MRALIPMARRLFSRPIKALPDDAISGYNFLASPGDIIWMHLCEHFITISRFSTEFYFIIRLLLRGF